MALAISETSSDECEDCASCEEEVPVEPAKQGPTRTVMGRTSAHHVRVGAMLRM